MEWPSKTHFQKSKKATQNIVLISIEAFQWDSHPWNNNSGTSVHLRGKVRAKICQQNCH